ncbi:hypothetical protein NAL19_1170 [Pectobacterium sp. F1-1]|nr:hypothetical protein NAL19_1170 [Pectobacterium sp. F1-1]
MPTVGCNGHDGFAAIGLFLLYVDTFFVCLRVAEACPFLEHKRLEWYGLAFFKFIL